MPDTKDQHVDDRELCDMLLEKEKTHISQNLRVLAIDDNVVSLKVLARKLQKCGYRVTATTKASEAIEMLRKNKDEYDIVITDAIRSDMDGFKILEIIGLELDIPVIMISANGDMKNVEKGVKHGAIDYLVKPVPVEILKNIWQHVLRKAVRNPKPDVKEAKTLGYLLPNKRHRRDEDESGQSSEESLAQKKPRVVWKPWLHQKFVAAVQQLEVDKAVPKKILEIMNEPQLTRESVASHLQKYGNALRKQKESMSEERQSHIDTNGIPRFFNPIIHGPGGSHGLHTINLSDSYSENGMSSFTGRNPPFPPHNYHDTALQNRVPSEAANQMRKNMGVPVLKNVAPGAILTADPELSAMKYQAIQYQRNMVDHDHRQISAQLSGTGAVVKSPDSFTELFVGNSSHNLQVFSRPDSYSPPDAPCQIYGDATCQTYPFSEPHSVLGRASSSLPGQQDRRNWVSICGEGGAVFRGESTASPVDIQVDGSSGNYRVGHTQSFLDSSERSENSSHHMIEGSPDYDLSVMVKQFASAAAPRI